MKFVKLMALVNKDSIPIMLGLLWTSILTINVQLDSSLWLVQLTWYGPLNILRGHRL